MELLSAILSCAILFAAAEERGSWLECRQPTGHRSSPWTKCDSSVSSPQQIPHQSGRVEPT
ncbi:hypothetical protein INR49_007765 [Caranx melampygus]|nr:hypothetical protein INR49_007765 [Caranx melampygus]